MRLLGRRARPDDPGAEWAESVLRPLRAQRIDPDVRRSVMARIAGERIPTLSHAAPLRRPRLAFVLCVLGGVTSFGLVVAALLMLAINGDEGVRQIAALLASAGHLVVVVGGVILSAAKGILSAVVALGRGLWSLLEAASPVLWGAGLVAAALGLLSIPISAYLVAQGYRSAPLIAVAGDGVAPGGDR